MGINFVLPDILSLTLKVMVAIDLIFMNHQGPRFQLEIFVLLKMAYWMA